MERVTKIFEHAIYKKELQSIQNAEIDRAFCGHDMQHFLDVARISWILCMERGFSLEKDVVYAAALLHDIGRGLQYREGTSHDIAGVLLAEQILPECGYTDEEVQQICEAISGHRMSCTDGKVHTSFGEILKEADHMGRCCFSCKAESECYWPKEKKNLKIRM